MIIFLTLFGDYIETHEIYNIDKKKREFTLLGFIGLCRKCHLFIHQGFLEIMLFNNEITEKEAYAILDRGNKMLKDAGLKKLELSNEEIHNPKWYLLYNGKKYSNCL